MSASSPEATIIRVATIAAAQECALYEGIRYSSESKASGSSRGYVAGSGSGYSNAYGGGGSSSFSAGGSSSYSASNKTSFETFFVKDCTDNFAGIRVAMQAALAASGTIVVGSGGYVLTGRVEEVVPTGSISSDRSATGSSYASANQGLRVAMTLNLADKSGRIIFGAPIVTEIETGSAAAVRGTFAVNASSGDGLYSLLQRQLALAVARKIAFHFQPLLVKQGSGKKVQLNYGSPLVEVGSLVSITSTDGSSSSRYRVDSVSTGSALATQFDDSNSVGIAPGSIAIVIEKGDPAANQSRMERVELP